MLPLKYLFMIPESLILSSHQHLDQDVVVFYNLIFQKNHG